MANSTKLQIKRVHFTLEEDEKLRMLVQKYGESEWGMISSQMPNRSVRQCRERWQNHLSVSVQKRKWTYEEDELLKYKYSELGPKWKLMEPFFPGRTSINIRNRFSCLKRFSEIYNQNNNNYTHNQAHKEINQSPIPVNLSPISSPQNTFNFMENQRDDVSSALKQNYTNYNGIEEQPEFSEQFDDGFLNMDFGLEFLYDC